MLAVRFFETRQAHHEVSIPALTLSIAVRQPATRRKAPIATASAPLSMLAVAMTCGAAWPVSRFPASSERLIGCETCMSSFDCLRCCLLSMLSNAFASCAAPRRSRITINAPLNRKYSVPSRQRGTLDRVGDSPDPSHNHPSARSWTVREAVDSPRRLRTRSPQNGGRREFQIAGAIRSSVRSTQKAPPYVSMHYRRRAPSRRPSVNAHGSEGATTRRLQRPTLAAAARAAPDRPTT